MRKITALLDWAPLLRDDALRELEADWVPRILRLHEFVDEWLQTRDGLVGPWLSDETIQTIIAGIGSATGRRYFNVARSYVMDEAAFAKIEDPHAFLERLAGTFVADAFELFKEVTAGAWLQCGPVAKPVAKEDDAPVDPREFVPSRLRSETMDPGVFLGPLGSTVTAAIEDARRELEKAMLLAMSRDEDATLTASREPEVESTVNDSALAPVEKDHLYYRGLVKAICAKLQVTQDTWTAAQRIDGKKISRTSMTNFLGGRALAKVRADKQNALKKLIEESAASLGL